jgi:Uma2 family endonuclease
MSESVAILPKIKKTSEPRRVSIEAYLGAEEKAIDKHEFHAGIITKMAGGTFNHSKISLKIGKLILDFIEANDYHFEVAESNIKIRVEALDKALYPDAVVIFDKPQFFRNRKDIITNPLVVIEILSKSTGKYDRDLKFEEYRTIPSFKEYVLVSQESKKVIVYTKQADKTWILREYAGDEDHAILFMVENCPISLKSLFRGIEF